MFAHVLALCFILRLLKRSNHYAPKSILIYKFVAIEQINLNLKIDLNLRICCHRNFFQNKIFFLKTKFLFEKQTFV